MLVRDAVTYQLSSGSWSEQSVAKVQSHSLAHGDCCPSIADSVRIIGQCRGQNLVRHVFSSRRPRRNCLVQGQNSDKRATNSNRLDEAAADFAKGVESGLNGDDIIAWQLGASDYSKLTQTQQEYVDKIKAKLSEKVKQQKEERERLSIAFKRGQVAYSRGQYDVSLVLFKDALDSEGGLSAFGGEIQLWLALAYQACGQEQDCISLYKQIEKTHPNSKIRKQAYELRYILEAPRLPSGPDERVNIPLLEDQSRYVKGPRRSTPTPPKMHKGQPREKTIEELFWDDYKPPLPNVISNRYFQIASAIVATSLAIYSTTLKH